MNVSRELIVPDRAREVAPATDLGALMKVIERAATDPSFDIDKLSKLLDVRERWEAAEARKAFTAAMAEFKANPPQIVKDKHVQFQTSKGVTAYDHATLGNVCGAIVKRLAEHGISHRWDIAQNEGRIKVTAILTHLRGHSESVSLHSAPEDSGTKNAIQSVGSAITYLQRYSLLAAVGLAAEDDMPDDDGRGSGKPVERITEGQVADLEALLNETASDKARFLKYLKVERLEDILAASYSTVVKMVEAKRRGAK